MITLLSPAKTLDFESAIPPVIDSFPLYPKESEQIIKKLRTLSNKRLASLMDISKDLVALNAERYQQWEPEFGTDAAKPAIFAFSGEVYRGLDAATLTPEEVTFCHDHLRILSGLHGMLRPLDRIRPHRLEMGTSLPIGRKKNLYDFWRKQITEDLNQAVTASGSEVVVNLASAEYAKVIDWKKVKAKVITPAFKEFKGGEYKVVMTYAKHARGEMARYIAQHCINEPELLKGFGAYQFMSALSSEGDWVFVRDAANSNAV